MNNNLEQNKEHCIVEDRFNYTFDKDGKTIMPDFNNSIEYRNLLANQEIMLAASKMDIFSGGANSDVMKLYKGYISLIAYLINNDYFNDRECVISLSRFNNTIEFCVDVTALIEKYDLEEILLNNFDLGENEIGLFCHPHARMKCPNCGAYCLTDNLFYLFYDDCKSICNRCALLNDSMRAEIEQILYCEGNFAAAKRKNRYVVKNMFVEKKISNLIDDMLDSYIASINTAKDDAANIIEEVFDDAKMPGWEAHTTHRYGVVLLNRDKIKVNLKRELYKTLFIDFNEYYDKILDIHEFKDSIYFGNNALKYAFKLTQDSRLKQAM